jgi:protein-disulfide isomerase
MKSNRPSKPPRSGGTRSPADRRSAGPGRPQYRAGGKSLSRAGTRGATGSGISPLVGWTVGFGVIAAAVVVVALLVSSNKGSVDLTTPIVYTPSNIVSNGRTLGNPNAPVTVDLYSDFRCTSCATFTTGGTESRIVDEYVAPGKAKLVWHDRLVIDDIQGVIASRDAANAAMCAADQGKFWIMHDWLYANQSPTEDPSAFTKSRLSEIGKAAGLDMSEYQPCLDRGTHDVTIEADDARAKTIAPGTPTVYVNGTHVGDASYVPTFSQIEAAINAVLGPTSTPTASPSPAPTAPPSLPPATPALSTSPSVKPG